VRIKGEDGEDIIHPIIKVDKEEEEEEPPQKSKGKGKGKGKGKSISKKTTKFKST